MELSLIQFTVPVKNEVSQLRKLTMALEREHVAVSGLAWQAEGEAGFIRFVTDKPLGTSKALEALGWTAVRTPVLASPVLHGPGDLSRLLKLLEDGTVAVQEMYGASGPDGACRLFLSVDRLERAEKLLHAFAETQLLSAR